MIKPSRNVLIAGVVFVVAAAVLFAFTISAALDKRAEPRPRPALHATVGSKLVEVSPMGYCVDGPPRVCDAPTVPTAIPVEPGRAITISLPTYITERPWFLTVQRVDPRTGREQREQITHLQPTHATLVLRSTPDLLLAAVDISVPSTIQDPEGNLQAQAVWGINTLPESAPKDLAPAPQP
ncbi:DUF2771 family protein [Tsukamurella sp. NPDC003166]|uniref:DUF2771 family protein n=1 Tax=Tsukamurella sp. NPDC003166 TaxID=3154444 RepID=UPI0033A81D49